MRKKSELNHRVHHIVEIVYLVAHTQGRPVESFECICVAAIPTVRMSCSLLCIYKKAGHPNGRDCVFQCGSLRVSLIVSHA
jgi:hypothetical protein